MLETMDTVTIETQHKAGHRERLKQRFISGKADSDALLLELLLTYAIPQKDVEPLARSLLERFGSLTQVLDADIATLCAHEGIKEHTAILLKLASRLSDKRDSATQAPGVAEVREPLVPDTTVYAKPSKLPAQMPKELLVRKRSGLFSHPMLREAIDVLPRLPESESLSDTRAFLRDNLRFSGESSRARFAAYIVQRMFPEGHADAGLRTFARAYEGRQELRDVCFYRFCKAEPLVYDVVREVLLPAMGAGYVERRYLRDYLNERFPTMKSVNECALAVVETLVEGGIAIADKQRLNFTYRDILVPSFAFVLYNEFPQPGMYDIGKIERNIAIGALLWQPDRLIPTLYELRNRRLISKLSEIDSVRQFTTYRTFEEAVADLVASENIL